MFKLMKSLFSSKKNVRMHKNLRDKFSQIYSKNIFGGNISRSGEGSNMEQTAEIRRVLPALVQELGIESFMDAPCGDFYWMRDTTLGVKQYIGVDIVDVLIEKNQNQFGDSSVNFMCLNLVDDSLPKVDLIFCRDCLVHLSFEDVHKVIRNFINSGSKYLLTTTFTGRENNADLIGNDIWRTLNLQLPPFNFPEPVKLINEKCTEYNGQFADKHLGLWRLEEISQKL